jgi:hypothetical protein
VLTSRPVSSTGSWPLSKLNNASGTCLRLQWRSGTSSAEKQGVVVTPYRRARGMHHNRGVCLDPSECVRFGRSDTNTPRRDAKTWCLSCAPHSSRNAFGLVPSQYHNTIVHVHASIVSLRQPSDSEHSCRPTAHCCLCNSPDTD